jgi:hypothetical protein
MRSATNLTEETLARFWQQIFLAMAKSVLKAGFFIGM